MCQVPHLAMPSADGWPYFFNKNRVIFPTNMHADTMQDIYNVTLSHLKLKGKASA